MSKCSPSDLTPSAGKAPSDLAEASLTPLDKRVLACGVGQYPWDDWERTALAAGLPDNVAALGRAVMREAYQHGWPDWLKVHCGWGDEGRTMIKLALQSEGEAKRRWTLLLETDGLRGDYDPDTKQWTWGYLRPDAQRLLSTL